MRGSGGVGESQQRLSPLDPRVPFYDGLIALFTLQSCFSTEIIKELLKNTYFLN